VLVLIGIGFAAGLITAISPCVLPVLPIVLAGGATSTTGRRPFAIIAGVVATFTVSVLVASRLLRALGLPDDTLRTLAIVLLFVMAATLIFRPLARLAERPFLFLTRRSGRDLGGGFLLGASLGLVFVPCGGPVLAAISAVAANEKIGVRAVAVTIAYALGAAVPMLLIAYGGRGAAAHIRATGAWLRPAMGAVVALTALALAFDFDQRFTTALPGYTDALQKHVERTGRAQRELAKLTGVDVRRYDGADSSNASPDYGIAPGFRSIDAWINSKPLTMRQLRGKVVLIDFWTYSCINCLRTLPHLKAWYARYHKDGLVIVGVHTPEFAFEHSLSNVRSATKRFGVDYPVALDNSYGTWNAYANQYWPAEYLIDRRGHVRHVHFGEGEYGQSERAIRMLLGEREGRLTQIADRTPRDRISPESYLGYARLERFLGTPVHVDKPWRYYFPEALPRNNLAFGGVWTIHNQRAVAVRNARLRFHVHALHVYLVLAGKGSVDVLADGSKERTVPVDGDRLYTLLDRPRGFDGILELRFTPGISAYAFTFG
jgi:cytochrome c biogenesis protein CcdA/thiol-disulfide isomerase/thioredoxin